jgi:hypothetical protein
MKFEKKNNNIVYQQNYRLFMIPNDTIPKSIQKKSTPLFLIKNKIIK